MENKNILKTEIREYKSQGDYTIKINIRLNLEWTDEDDIGHLFEDETNTFSNNRDLLDGDKCREAYSIYNGGKIGTDDEVIEFVELEMKKEIAAMVEKVQKPYI